jgi:hypothetical protein
VEDTFVADSLVPNQLFADRASVRKYKQVAVEEDNKVEPKVLFPENQKSKVVDNYTQSVKQVVYRILQVAEEVVQYSYNFPFLLLEDFFFLLIEALH